MLLKQGQSASPITFLLVDSAGAAVTGATPTVVISKNGSGFGAPAGSVSEVGNGVYKVAGNVDDSDTLGPLVLYATAAGAVPAWRELQVVAFDPGDNAALGLSRLDAAVSSRLATGGYTAPDNSGIATAAAAAASAATDAGTLLTNLAALAAKLSGITSLAMWLRLLGRKANNDATALSEMNADAGAGVGTFDPTSDSTEAVRDRGDAAWRGSSAYLAQITLTVDAANSQDEYTVQWFRDANDGNGPQLVTSGLTTPLIEVKQRADGLDLIAETAMTAIGSTGALKFDEDEDRMTAGEAVLVTVKATIDGSERVWRETLSRDSN